MNMRAISPVIATVIIVSVAIAIAVAVAFWMTGITGLFTRYVFLKTSAYSSGQIVEIKVHTAAGNEYPKSVQLP